jgi:hypothetical protein
MGGFIGFCGRGGDGFFLFASGSGADAGGSDRMIFTTNEARNE